MARFRVERRIPREARAAFHGQSRMRRYFEDTPEGRAAAELWADDIERRLKVIRAGGQLASVGVRKSVTFERAAAGWLAQTEIKPATLAWYSNTLASKLVPELGNTSCSAIDKARLDAYKLKRRRETNKLGRPTSARSIQSELDIALRVLKWAKLAGYAVDDTAWAVVRPEAVPQVSRSYNPDALAMFLDAARRGPAPNPKKRGRKHPKALEAVALRDLTVVTVLSRLGLRAGELRSWIRWSERRVVVPADSTYTPKGGTERAIPLELDVWGLLLYWLDERRTGLVFEPERPGWRAEAGGKRKAHHRGTGIDLEAMMIRISEQAGVRFRAHDLRHYAISRWVDLMQAGGYSLADVQAWAGHVDIRTTQLYVHQAGARWRAHAASLDRARVAPGFAPSAPSRSTWLSARSALGAAWSWSGKPESNRRQLAWE